MALSGLLNAGASATPIGGAANAAGALGSALKDSSTTSSNSSLTSRSSINLSGNSGGIDTMTLAIVGAVVLGGLFIMRR